MHMPPYLPEPSESCCLAALWAWAAVCVNPENRVVRTSHGLLADFKGGLQICTVCATSRRPMYEHTIDYALKTLAKYVLAHLYLCALDTLVQLFFCACFSCGLGSLQY